MIQRLDFFKKDIFPLILGDYVTSFPTGLIMVIIDGNTNTVLAREMIMPHGIEGVYPGDILRIDVGALSTL